MSGNRVRVSEIGPFRGRLLAFRLIALVLPLALLGLGELACRLGGYGGHPPMIRRVAEDGDHAWFGTNRAGTNTYFKGRQVTGGGMREMQFRTPKLPGTVRILFLGESAIQGFPQPLPLTNGSFLEVMLHDAWDGARRVEVLNLGATAMASFPVAGILGEALSHEPDLVVLMVGNNEFYGAYGVASLPVFARSPAGMRVLHSLRSLGSLQWLEARVSSPGSAGGALMERLALGPPVLSSSPLRSAAESNLKANLIAMIQECTQRHVPVIVCTSPTNERDLSPIGVDVDPRLSTEERLRFDDNVSRAETLLSSDPKMAAQLAGEALELWSDHARAQYLLGRALTKLERHDEARIAYVRARDLDTMPWRATTRIQDAARTAAEAGAIFCDMEAAFRAESNGGAIGWELLDDHVHLSLRGQALFARTIARAMTAMPLPLQVDHSRLEALPTWEAYAEGLGHSVYSDYLAVTHLLTLFNIPFMKRSNEGAARQYRNRLEELRVGMDEVDSLAIERWRDPRLHGATERPLEFVVGQYRMAAGDWAAAAGLFRVARASVSVLSLWRLELSWRLLTCNRHLNDSPTPEDERLGREVVRIGELLNQHAVTTNPQVLRYLGLGYNLAGRDTAAASCLEKIIPNAKGRDDWEVVEALVDSYRATGRNESALALLNRAVQDSGMALPARRMLSELQAPPTAK